jgi:hypothetical protein
VVVDDFAATNTSSFGSDSDDGAAMVVGGGVGSGMVCTNLRPIGSTDGTKAATLVVVDHVSNIMQKNDGIVFMTWKEYSNRINSSVTEYCPQRRKCENVMLYPDNTLIIPLGTVL